MLRLLDSLAAARQALFDLPPAAVGLLLLAGVLLVVVTVAVGALVTFDVLDAGPPPRHQLRPGGLRVDMLCQSMSHWSPGEGREASTDHRLPEPPGSTPGPALAGHSPTRSRS